MARSFIPGEFHDTYREELKKLLDARARGEAPAKASTRPPQRTNVVDLVSVLERSLAASKKSPAKEPKPRAAADAARGHTRSSARSRRTNSR
jgi:DNA end-binding protein Ku